MKNNITLTSVILASTLILSITFAFSKGNTNQKNVDFLKSYGWEVEPEPTDTVEFIIPEVFDDVYQNYNELQVEAGLDLSKYRGFSAVRNTYRLLNFPEETKDDVFANVVSVDSVPVGGDICTYALDGFMYSLNFNLQTCYSSSSIPYIFSEKKLR